MYAQEHPATIDRQETRPVNEASVRALQTGLAGVALLFVTLATFGPWFDYRLAFALTLGTMAVSSLGLWRADLALHSLRRHPLERGSAGVGLGILLSLISGGAAALLNGTLLLPLVVIVPLPPTLAILVPTVLVLVGLHRGRHRGEQAFRASVDLSRGTAACAGCRLPIPLAEGQWRGRGWLCLPCRVAGGEG